MKKLLRNKLLGAACLLLLPLGAGAQVQLDSVGRDQVCEQHHRPFAENRGCAATD